MVALASGSLGGRGCSVQLSIKSLVPAVVLARELQASSLQASKPAPIKLPFLVNTSHFLASTIPYRIIYSFIFPTIV